MRTSERLGVRMLQKAHRDGVALCGFDAFNMESAQALVEAAEALSSPLFLQVGVDSANHMGVAMAARILLEAKTCAHTDICVHLDHGRETSQVPLLKEAVDLGLESVMADGSALPLADNVALCREVVAVAHPRGVCVEGELGRVSRNLRATREELDQLMTDPDEAARLAEETGIDYLAVSVGSVSGFTAEQRTLHLDLDRLEKIARNVNCPLVLHGGTGIPPDQLRAAVEMGVAKVNIAHGFRKAFLDGIATSLAAQPSETDPRRVLAVAREAARAFACQRIRQLAGLPAQ